MSVSARPSPEIARTVHSSHWLTVLTHPLPLTSLSLIWRVSGRTSRSPIFHPETAADSVKVVLPARGSVASRTKVGVRTLPCIVVFPKTTIPVPN